MQEESTIYLARYQIYLSWYTKKNSAHILYCLGISKDIFKYKEKQIPCSYNQI